MKSLISKAQLIQDFNDAQKGFIDSVNQSMEYAFQMGDILIQLKEITPHGQFESVLKNETRFAFGERYAQMLMKIAANRSLVLEHSKGEALSIREMNKLISDTKKATKSAGNSESDGEATINATAVKSQQSFGKEGRGDVIEGEYTDVSNNEPDPAPPALPSPELESEPLEESYTELDQLRDTVAALAEENARLEADNNRMRAIFEDDNHTAAAIKENDKLASINTGLQSRIDGLLNENSAMQRQLNKLDRRCKMLDKKLKEAGHE